MERLADYISWATRMELEGKVVRTAKNLDPAQQDAGGDCQGVRDETGSPQRHQSGVGQAGSPRGQD